MQLPLHVNFAVEEASLNAERQVTLKTLRLATGIDVRRFQGFAAIAMPLVVVDRGAVKTRYLPVVDGRTLLGGLTGLAAARGLIRHAGRRKRRRHNAQPGGTDNGI